MSVSFHSPRRTAFFLRQQVGTSWYRNGEEREKEKGRMRTRRDRRQASRIYMKGEMIYCWCCRSVELQVTHSVPTIIEDDEEDEGSASNSSLPSVSFLFRCCCFLHCGSRMKRCSNQQWPVLADIFSLIGSSLVAAVNISPVLGAQQVSASMSETHQYMQCLICGSFCVLCHLLPCCLLAGK